MRFVSAGGKVPFQTDITKQTHFRCGDHLPPRNFSNSDTTSTANISNNQKTLFCGTMEAPHVLPLRSKESFQIRSTNNIPPGFDQDGGGGYFASGTCAVPGSRNPQGGLGVDSGVCPEVDQKESKGSSKEQELAPLFEVMGPDSKVCLSALH